MKDLHRYTIEFDYIENDHRGHTSYAGLEAESEAEAVKVAREWFGFDEDGVRVIHTVVKQED